MPYLMRLMPITSVTGKDVTDEPFNNLKNHQIVLAATEYSEKESILVFDSHYMDLEGTCFRYTFFFLILQGKKKLVADDRKFIAKVNPAWFPELAAEAKKHLGKREDDFVVLYSEELEEHFMMCNSMTSKGAMKTKCVITNAFVNTKASKGYPGTIPLLYFLLYSQFRIELYLHCLQRYLQC
jgi:hypothetical protein